MNTKYVIRQSIFVLFLLGSLNHSLSQKTTINNSKPKNDISGQIVDAHDGRVVQFGDNYYWYGTSYGNTNGFVTSNHYVCYSSKDLQTWKKEGRLLPNQSEGVYYRPHVIYNAKTKKYVLWYNWYPKLWEGQFGVAVSDTPHGPFNIVNKDVKMARSEMGLGDFGLFVDDDGIAFISYNTINNHQVSIEKLNSDYLSSTMENGGVISEHMEAGSQFKRNGKYYLLTDHTCCFCNYGSGARVYISDNPFTGYTLTTNINRYPGKFAPLLHDGNTKGTLNETLKKKDSIFESVESVFHDESRITGITLDVFTGNRPENCGDVNNPRVHPEIATPEFKVYRWDFDRWKEVQITNVQIEKSALRERVTLQFDSFSTSRIKITPSNKNAADAIYINEVEFDMAANDSIIGSYITGKHIPEKPIIPAQQTYVMQLNTSNGEKFIWMGDLWGSASDNIKGHDYQYWSKPLEFFDDGTIKPLEWTDQWSTTPSYTTKKQSNEKK